MRFADSDTIRKHDLSSVNFIWATGGKLSKDYVLAMLDLFPRREDKDLLRRHGILRGLLHQL